GPCLLLGRRLRRLGLGGPRRFFGGRLVSLWLHGAGRAFGRLLGGGFGRLLGGGFGRLLGGGFGRLLDGRDRFGRRLDGRFGRRLASGVFSLGDLRLELRLGGEPEPVRIALALRSSFLLPQVVRDLSNASLAIGHFRPPGRRRRSRVAA